MMHVFAPVLKFAASCDEQALLLRKYGRERETDRHICFLPSKNALFVWKLCPNWRDHQFVLRFCSLFLRFRLKAPASQVMQNGYLASLTIFGAHILGIVRSLQQRLEWFETFQKERTDRFQFAWCSFCRIPHGRAVLLLHSSLQCQNVSYPVSTTPFRF